jgi:hypothetical protein
MEEIMKDKEPNIEDYAVLKKYEYVFGEFPIFLSKSGIDLCIELIP